MPFSTGSFVTDALIRQDGLLTTFGLNANDWKEDASKRMVGITS